MLDCIRRPRQLEQPGSIGVQVVEDRPARCQRLDDSIACFKMELLRRLVHGCERCRPSPRHGMLTRSSTPKLMTRARRASGSRPCNDAGSSCIDTRVESSTISKQHLGMQTIWTTYTWGYTMLDCKVAIFRKVDLLYYTKGAVAQSKPLETSQITPRNAMQHKSAK